MRYLFALLVICGAAAYVLLDSKALVFHAETLDKTELVERQAYKPEFHPDRLEVWFNNLVSKFSK